VICSVTALRRTSFSKTSMCSSSIRRGDMCEFTRAGVVHGDYRPYLDAHPATGLSSRSASYRVLSRRRNPPSRERGALAGARRTSSARAGATAGRFVRRASGHLSRHRHRTRRQQPEECYVWYAGNSAKYSPPGNDTFHFVGGGFEVSIAQELSAGKVYCLGRSRDSPVFWNGGSSGTTCRLIDAVGMARVAARGPVFFFGCYTLIYTNHGFMSSTRCI
jgi:hypothetical protein